MFKIVDDEKNRVSEEELLGAIEENEEPRPVLPKYLRRFMVGFMKI